MQVSEVMMLVVQDVEQELVDERNELFMWIHDTFPMLSNTGDDTEELRQEREMVKKEYARIGESIDQLLKSKTVDEVALKYIEKNMHYQLDALGTGCSVQDYATVGMMQGWLRAWNECDKKAVIEYTNTGNWSVLEEAAHE